MTLMYNTTCLVSFPQSTSLLNTELASVVETALGNLIGWYRANIKQRKWEKNDLVFKLPDSVHKKTMPCFKYLQKNPRKKFLILITNNTKLKDKYNNHNTINDNILWWSNVPLKMVMLWYMPLLFFSSFQWNMFKPKILWRIPEDMSPQKCTQISCTIPQAINWTMCYLYMHNWIVPQGYYKKTTLRHTMFNNQSDKQVHETITRKQIIFLSTKQT